MLDSRRQNNKNQTSLALTNLLETRNGRFLSFGLMYVSEGIPYGFTATAVVAYLRGQEVGLDEIGILVAALLLPWSFKWAWAPLVDLFRFNALGGRKAWIVFCTSMMVLCLSLILVTDAVADFQLLLTLVVLNNFFAATQDVAIDSLAVSTLQPEERARGNGFMFGGQNLGITLGGAGAIALFGLIGFDAALLLMCALLALNLGFIVLFVTDPEAGAAAAGGRISEAFRSFFTELRKGFLGSGRGPLVALLFSVLPIGAMALSYATLSTILVDFGLDEGGVSLVVATYTLCAALGCIVGGFLADRLGLRPTLFGAYFGTALLALTLAVAIDLNGLAGVSYNLLVSVIAINGVIFGCAFGARSASFMGISNPMVGATMFTTFMAMSNLIVSFTNFWQGQVAERFDYAAVLCIDAALVLIPLCVIPLLRTREETAVSG